MRGLLAMTAQIRGRLIGVIGVGKRAHAGGDRLVEGQCIPVFQQTLLRAHSARCGFEDRGDGIGNGGIQLICGYPAFNEAPVFGDGRIDDLAR